MNILASIAVIAAFTATAAVAELPPPTDAARAKTEETRAKGAWETKVEAFRLCQVQDRVAAQYRRAAAAANRAVGPPTPTEPCRNPGAFVYTPNRPLEAAGAHSPAETAASPPSSVKPHAEIEGGNGKGVKK